jgi:hypothetical protein
MCSDRLPIPFVRLVCFPIPHLSLISNAPTTFCIYVLHYVMYALNDNVALMLSPVSAWFH